MKSVESTITRNETEKIMSTLLEMVEAVRCDKVVGRGTCTVIDEAYTDDELADMLSDRNIRSIGGAVRTARAVERLRAEYDCGLESGEFGDDDAPARPKAVEVFDNTEATGGMTLYEWFRGEGVSAACWSRSYVINYGNRYSFTVLSVPGRFELTAGESDGPDDYHTVALGTYKTLAEAVKSAVRWNDLEDLPRGASIRHGVYLHVINDVGHNELPF